jgi:hypothetical protein
MFKIVKFEKCSIFLKERKQKTQKETKKKYKNKQKH